VAKGGAVYSKGGENFGSLAEFVRGTEGRRAATTVHHLGGKKITKPYISNGRQKRKGFQMLTLKRKRGKKRKAEGNAGRSNVGGAFYFSMGGKGKETQTR